MLGVWPKGKQQSLLFAHLQLSFCIFMNSFLALRIFCFVVAYVTWVKYEDGFRVLHADVFFQQVILKRCRREKGIIEETTILNTSEEFRPQYG